MAINSKTDTRGQSLHEIQNQSFDKEFQTSVTQPLGYDGQNLQRKNADNLSLKVVESGSITYVCIAAPGTAQATAKWQCKKIDESVAGTMVITWADSNAEFDNVATDPTSLTYL